MANTLNHSPSDVIRWLIIQLGLGSNPESEPQGAWPVYAGSEPQDPDNCISVFDTDAPDYSRSQIDGMILGHRGVMIRVRSRTHQIGWIKVDAILTAFAEQVYQSQVIIGTGTGTATDLYLVHCLASMSKPLPLGIEPNSKRRIFSFNAIIALKQE